MKQNWCPSEPHFPELTEGERCTDARVIPAASSPGINHSTPIFSVRDIALLDLLTVLRSGLEEENADGAGVDCCDGGVKCWRQTCH